MSTKQNDVWAETLKEQISQEFLQEKPKYEKITLWRTELLELGYQPEITPKEEAKFWGEVLTPTKEEELDEDFEFPLQDPESRPEIEEDIDTNAQLRGSER